MRYRSLDFSIHEQPVPSSSHSRIMQWRDSRDIGSENAKDCIPYVAAASTIMPSSVCSAPHTLPHAPTLIHSQSLPLVVYEVGLGFIFRLPPVMVTLTKRRVYVILFLARPLGVFFFSCGSTCSSHYQCVYARIVRGWRGVSAYLWGLRLDLSGTCEGSVNLSHDCGCCAFFGAVVANQRLALRAGGAMKVRGGKARCVDVGNSVDSRYAG